MKPKINAIEIESRAGDVNQVYRVGESHANVSMYRGAKYVTDEKTGQRWEWISKRYYYVTRSSLLRCQRAQVKLMER